MKWWPFGGSEHRAEPDSGSYTALRLAEALATAATPDPAAPDRSAAAVGAGGLLGRSLAAADVQPAGQVATALEAVLFDDRRLAGAPRRVCVRPDLHGPLGVPRRARTSRSPRAGRTRASGLYIVTLSGPGRQEVRQLRGPEVLHFQDPRGPRSAVGGPGAGRQHGRARPGGAGNRVTQRGFSAARDHPADPRARLIQTTSNRWPR